ncbi:GNAT family N-acetyltransferase [Alkalihalobacillus sp. LMS6]|uniref:GNAT family N-acetyltransferase n=1 Tax=Alkalihalobacillus sp. LMS6 TaxID=2924034 RepID=UPI0020D1E03A|nr:GNAT family N-acetyltransferase [Alkalihalobacillus sp. LMS6]UTR05898.1 GNAT family N-acetyltransferase [Alkalihalobacillus sp. LMS6]
MYIRPFEKKDTEKLLGLSSRFLEFQLLQHRDKLAMEKKQNELLEDAIQHRAHQLFVAEEDDQFLGYLEIGLQQDFFTKEQQVYIAGIATTSEAQGRGVGKELMTKAEQWAREQGVKTIVLDVFKANEHAVRFYEYAGYQQEIVKMTKTIED